MTNRKALVSAAATIIILLVGGGIFQTFVKQKKSTLSDDPIPVEIYYVQATTFPSKTVQSKISIDGRLTAVEKIDIAAEVSGRLQPINRSWRKGSFFKAGDLLFKVDSDDSRLNLYAQRSSLLNAITQIMPDLKFDYKDAFEKWKTYLDNFDVEKTTPALPTIGSQQEKYFVAGKNIYNLYYSIKSAEDRLKNFSVYAPFSGVFLSINSFPGALVSPGAPLGRLMNTGKLEMETPISMSQLDLVKTGQMVNLFSEELGKSYKGRISRISNQIDQTTQSIPLYISVSGTGLRDGMYLTGELEGNSIQEVSAIPNEAIVNQNQVYFVKDSLIQEKSVQIVLRGEDEVFVKGILPEEEIITTGLNSLSPGQKAAVIK